ncbi:MAG: 3-oxoacyl-ACP reductase FabG [Thaumarchaeota archaeon]|nr:3-oxoacyl-ACP reductase FabG [Nitrososphaerota archaeon]
MPGKLDDKVALITGGARGIGKATAELFAREGAKVCINYSSAEREATELVRVIGAAGGEAIALKGDVAKEAEVMSMVGKAIERFGRIDILVNNAGILRTGDLFTLKDEDLDAMFSVNVKGTIYCTRAVGRHMLERAKGGKVVNVASNAGVGTSFKGTTGYALTKAAVLLLTKRFALEFRGRDINVNCVAPGYTETDMTVKGKTAEQFEQAAADIAARSMLNRIAKAKEIASAILFLASEDASFATGQTLLVDGGRMDYLTHGF